jgi:uncharacterized protein (TIGR02118 family)
VTIYRSGVFNRREGITPEQFTAHWINVHGALAKKLPGLGTYRQNHLKERLYEAPDSPVQSIDGISQLSFESVRHMEISDASPEYAECKLDIPKFQGGITILVLESDEIMPGPRGPAKILWVSTRRDGVPAQDVRKRWLEANSQAGRDIPGARSFVQNFVTDRSHPVAAGVPSGDASGAEAVSELWFDDADAARAAVQSAAGRKLIFEDPLLRPVGVYRVEEIHIK